MGQERTEHADNNNYYKKKATAIRSKVQDVKKKALFRITLLTSLFAAIILAARLFVYPLLSDQGASYIQMAEAGIFGYFMIRIFTELSVKLMNGHSESQGRSIRSIIRIGGLLIILAIIIAMLAKDPYVTLAITTITGIALAVSIQSIIGNAIAGLVLAVVRPFRIGDEVTVLAITCKVRDIGLLYVRLTTVADKKTVLVPNATMISTAIIKEKRADHSVSTTNAGNQAQVS